MRLPSQNPRKVFINLGVEDLKAEYERIKQLGIAIELTPIRYINVFSPYWYFTFMDPDGNPIEITGGYTEE
ncbi:MAG: VOC family protein [Lachnospiraceae bacterium]|nr:VOC family protein [Lachnospiraceae bacterium]